MIAAVPLLVRIAIGGALGGVIGYERDRHRRPVGLRTHLIVAMAAATFMVVSSQFVYRQHYGDHDLVTVDPSRIAASVVSGIGFIAGGAILRTGLTVQGLTTAAGLWLVTAIGMSAGAGMFVISAVVTVMGIVALTLLRRFEDKDLVRRRISVVLAEGGFNEVASVVRRVGGEVLNVDYEHWLDAERRIEVTLDVQLTDTVSVGDLVSALEGVAGVQRLRIQQHI